MEKQIWPELGYAQTSHERQEGVEVGILEDNGGGFPAEFESDWFE